MPWLWERALRRDSALWTNFMDFLTQLETAELQRLVGVGAEKHERQAGMIEGIRLVYRAATAEEQEEIARASR